MRITNPQTIFGERILDINDISNPFKSVQKTLTTDDGVYCTVSATELGITDFDQAQLTQAHVHTSTGLTLIYPDIAISEDKTTATITFFTHEDDWQSYLVISEGNIYEAFITFYTRSEEGIAVREPQIMDSPVEGYPVKEITTTSITVVNGNWYKVSLDDNSTLTVVPAEWQSRIATCFVETTNILTISGVQWLYGEPTMTSGNRYVIAIQQIDADTVLANLAFVLSAS